MGAIVQQSCGIPELDQAAVDAFAEGKFYPNPPKEMVKDDQRIHLNYAFVVTIGPTGWLHRGF